MPDLTPANENPWYVLATIRGEQDADGIDGALHAENLKTWNRFMVSALDEDAIKSLKPRFDPDELVPMTDQERADLEERMADRGQALPRAGTPIDFTEVVFSRPCVFNGFVFPNQVDFRGARFQGDASFSEAAFQGYAHFSEAVFPGDAYFRKAAFRGGALFDEAAFQGGAYFSEAAFPRYADFSEVAFQGDAYFRRATFHDNAFFSKAAFQGAAYFSAVEFQGYAAFNEAAFQGDASFSKAAFQDGALFGEAAFQGYADFSVAAFQGGAFFSEAAFHGDASFYEASFPGYADFSGGPREGASGRDRSRAINGRFDMDPDDRGATLSASLLAPVGVPSSARRAFGGGTDFEGASFSGGVSFLNRVFLSATSFDGTRFRVHPPMFADAELHQGTTWRRTHWPSHPAPKDADDHIDAYAQLRLRMNEIQDHDAELEFFARELAAKRVKAGWSFAGLVILLYQALSDCGRSVGRPIAWFGALIGAFGPVFHGPLVGTDRAEPLWSFYGFAAASLTGLLGTRREFFRGVTETLPGWMQVVSGGLSFVGAVLVFLMALAIRNRFRIR